MRPIVRGGSSPPRHELLFDQNLSFKLCQTVADLFPDSVHVRLLGLSEVGDRAIWDYAKANGFAIVSQDADFAEMAALLGSAESDLVANREPIDGNDLDPVTAARQYDRRILERRR